MVLTFAMSYGDANIFEGISFLDLLVQILPYPQSNSH